ncbi:MAG: transglutaminase-like domain-containing protein, partial [Longimicrobiales bacterium]
LQPGREATLRVFDPSSLAERDVHVRVTATESFHVTDSVRLQPDGRWARHTVDTVPAWRIEQTVGGVEVASWVDEDGVLVGAETPLGFVITRTAFELARQDWQQSRGRPELAAGYGAVIESSAIASNVALDDVANAPSLSVRLRNVNLTGLDVAGGRQELRGDTLTVRRESDNELATSYSLPYRGGGEAAQELAATLLMQSEDARIVKAASEVIGDTNEPLLAARRLNDWVYGALRKEVTPSVPSALQVLEARRGDCNEHTVLFVAMARAIGLPARSAAGLVHLRGRFYYHAWPEVWLGERWVAVDPTLGQFPADASHLRFLVGGLARQLELIRLIGRLQIEVV